MTAYRVRVSWEPGPAPDTSHYERYSRAFRAEVAGKPALAGSADPAFRGDARRHNPEELLVAALASCHMLSYLALCARRGVRVLSYEDDAEGRLVLAAGGGGRFEEVVLHPRVVVDEGADAALAVRLHERAHAACFIASSCSFPVACRPEVAQGAAAASAEEPARALVRHDLAIRLPDRPGALAALGEVLGAAGVSIEGGGGFSVGGDAAIVHFLVEDAAAAAAALRAANIELLAVREVVAQRLDQERPGQLGALARAMADAGVNIECVYSDHGGQLIVVADDPEAGARVSRSWSTAAR